MTARGSIPEEESNLIEMIENPQNQSFSGIVFEYDLHYKLQNNYYWKNGILVQENLAMKLEQESNELTRSDCNPVYASVWVPEECPNIGQPGHTGHFCLTGERWEQVFAGYDI
jgi:hypothetical protein